MNETRARIPRFLRLFCVPVLLAWLAVTGVVNVVVPQLETVGEANSTSLTSSIRCSRALWCRILRSIS